jgi:2-amino-4-hydroxy-6-hydroxymethyldihydropteridine diphosphokinase
MRAVVALGANLGKPRNAIELAIALLRESTEVIACSSLYVTAPVGGPAQPDYVNAVCILDSQLCPDDLLSLLHGIEKCMGRIREERWGPRVIDLDLITYGNLVSEDPDLTLPHPRAHERAFVLEPWLEIDSDAELPSHGRVSQILAELAPSK